MNILGILSKILPEGNFKDRLRIPVYWTLNRLRFVKREVKLYKNVKGVFCFSVFDKKFSNREIEGYFKNYVPKEGDVVVDAGAFHGHFTVVASKLVGNKGKVIAIEPDPFNFDMLRKNIKANKLNNIILINRGLSDKRETIKWSVGGIISQQGNSDIFKVKTETLDEIFDENKIKEIAMVKMDIEGAEIKALHGASKMLKHTKTLAIASYHIVDGKKTCFEVEKILKNKGFNAKTEESGQLITFARK